MTQTLYEKYKPKWKALAQAGFPNLAEMSKHFYMMGHMDHALGYASAVSKWCGRPNSRPQSKAEVRATEWMKGRIRTDVQSPKQPEDTDQTFLIICPPEKSAKVQKILTLLGCDFVDV